MGPAMVAPKPSNDHLYLAVFALSCQRTHVTDKGSWMLWRFIFLAALSESAETRKGGLGVSGGATREMLLCHPNPRPTAILVSLFELAKYTSHMGSHM